jgi:ATP-binding cassette subfamily B protein
VSSWQPLTWAEHELPEAVAALAARSGLLESARAGRQQQPKFSRAERSGAELLEAAADDLGLDAVPVELSYAELGPALARLAPALVRVELGQEPELPGSPPRPAGYLAIVRSDRRRLSLLTPALGERRIATSRLRDHLAAALRGQWGAIVETWLEQANVAPRRRRGGREQLLSLTLAGRSLDGIWLLQRDPGAAFARGLSEKGCARLALIWVAAASLQIGWATLAWWVLGRAVLQELVGSAWLQAWLLAGATCIPLQVLTVWSSGRLGIGLADLLKRRLLCGALRLPPDTIRSRGSGGLLAMVSESQAVERAGLDGAFSAFVALLQLVGAGAVLALGAGGALHVALLALECGAIAALGVRLTRALSAWTEQRFELSQRFVECVQGHRTRLVQGDPDTWHTAEDAQLQQYAGVLAARDRCAVLLSVWTGRGWFILGFIGLIPALLNAAELPGVALSLLGILQAQRAFELLGRSLEAILSAAVAWRSVRPLFEAGARGAPGPLFPVLAEATAPPAPLEGGARRPSTVLELRGLSYRHPGRERWAVKDCHFSLKTGDRLLLEGASGSGKSTLARLLTGIHRPCSGLLLADGLDPSTLGEAQWRKRIASAPQFYENHLLSAPLSFNLLMGRNWPPTAGDVAAALDTCRALGLDSLIRRMPSGIHQMIGETGWQLSHGERSRVFLARALLQRANVVILDETFGALDPDTLELCMKAVRERAPTLVVIAHP